jgi:hypothetical protein
MVDEPTPRTEGPTPRADKARAGMTAELAGITEAMHTLIEHMDQSLPEERVKALLETATAEDRNSRKRLRYLIVGLLIVVTAVMGTGAVLLWRNSATLNEAKTVSNYIKHCLIAPPGERDVQECGQDGSAAIIKGLIGSINCSLLIPPAERSEEKLNACAAKAFSSG